MNLYDVVKAARAANPATFGNTDDKRAVEILRAALRQVRRQLRTSEEGELVISGFGRFAIKKVEREQDGMKVTKRRVVFREDRARKRRRARKSKAGES